MKKDIIIVDDEKDIRELISGILSDEGFETRFAKDIDSLKIQLIKRVPSLILLDVWLDQSNADGIDILKVLKKSYPHIPVIMISGHGTIDMAINALKIGAFDFIEKPLPDNEFIVDVSNNLLESFFTISNLSRPTLHLEMGKYTFTQESPNNFNNRIKFSITEDGIHNNGREYKKGVKQYGISAGSKTPNKDNIEEKPRTELVISATTPSPLYYYSSSYPKMGGKIETKNNVVLTQGNIFIIDNVLTIDNSSILHNKLPSIMDKNFNDNNDSNNNGSNNNGSNNNGSNNNKSEKTVFLNISTQCHLYEYRDHNIGLVWIFV